MCLRREGHSAILRQPLLLPPCFVRGRLPLPSAHIAWNPLTGHAWNLFPPCPQGLVTDLEAAVEYYAVAEFNNWLVGEGRGGEDKGGEARGCKSQPTLNQTKRNKRSPGRGVSCK